MGAWCLGQHRLTGDRQPVTAVLWPRSGLARSERQPRELICGCQHPQDRRAGAAVGESDSWGPDQGESLERE